MLLIRKFPVRGWLQKIWKLFIDKDMKMDRESKDRISHYIINKLNKRENVKIDAIEKTSRTLDLHIGAIVGFIRKRDDY